ncbi:hypothetical protein [Gloeobacter violaceus]|uniref:Gll3933 protein n=1 Tax=Gloeobacter violaceus (strain ATCC 29082 / PCC 7421) TaxID=251221 RepID=Q7NEE7_GLOVI|nr:hypothetical protein [Gloeobacter violaceus]BAC91874.1 gll3933 [Gloeobacter violaceus PCC 7421]
MKKLLLLGILALGIVAAPAQAQYYPSDYGPGYQYNQGYSNGNDSRYTQGYNDGYRCGRYEDCAGARPSQYSRSGYSSSGYNTYGRSGYSNYGRPQSLEGVLIQQGLNMLLRSVR